MNNTLSVLYPVKTLTVGGETVEVRELAWGPAVAVLRDLSSEVGKILTRDGKLSISTDQVADVVGQSAALAESLVLKATGRDKAWWDGLRPCDALEVLDCALALNLSDTLFERGKAVAARLKAAFAGGKGGDPSTKSSPSAATS